jgi:hypothetical protein
VAWSAWGLAAAAPGAEQVSMYLQASRAKHCILAGNGFHRIPGNIRYWRVMFAVNMWQTASSVFTVQQQPASVTDAAGHLSACTALTQPPQLTQVTVNKLSHLRSCSCAAVNTCFAHCAGGPAAPAALLPLPPALPAAASVSRNNAATCAPAAAGGSWNDSVCCRHKQGASSAICNAILQDRC